MIYLNNYNFTKKKLKNKHLTKEMYEKIESEYNCFLFSKNNKIAKTTFMKKLALTIGTSLSNLYDIINDGLITVKDYDLRDRIEFNANTA